MRKRAVDRLQMIENKKNEEAMGVETVGDPRQMLTAGFEDYRRSPEVF